MVSTSRNPARIAGMFDRIAVRYDMLNRLISLGMDKGWRARAVRELALGGSERVLDMCTGTGDVAGGAATSASGRAASDMLTARAAGVMVIPGVQTLHLWYLRYLLPLVGRLLSKHGEAYEYLPASVEQFPPPEVFATLLTQQGFASARAVPLTFGIVFLYVATKAPETAGG